VDWALTGSALTVYGISSIILF